MTARPGRTGPRYGLVADVHSNLQALQTALAWIDEKDVDAVYCLGDVVGYGGDPAACVALVRERCAGTVRGNHDVAIFDTRLRGWFNPHARAAIERQAALLGPDEVAWLEALPATIELGETRLTHSGFAEPAAFDYVMDARDAAVELEALEARWGFLAHTHVPACWHRDPTGAVAHRSLSRDADGTALDDPGRWLVNPGAVGQPRDLDPRAACAVFDVGDANLLHARLDYDVEAAQAAIRRAGMPDFEAQRLAAGM